MALSPPIPVLSRPDDILTQQDIDSFFSRFSVEASHGLPLAMQFDTLLSLLRPVFLTRIAQLRGECDRRVSEGRREYDGHIAELRNEHEKQFAESRREYDNHIAHLRTEHEKQFAENRREYDTHIAQLRSDHDVQLAESRRESDTHIARLRESNLQFQISAQHRLHGLQEQLQRTTALHESLQQQQKELESKHAAEYSRLNAIYEGGRRQLVSQLTAANHMVEQSGARLESYLLRQPPTAAPVMRGSQSRAATWENLKNVRGNLFNQKLPVNPATLHEIKRITATEPLLVATFDFVREDETYPHIVRLLSNALNHTTTVASVFDTSRIPYLSGYKPDVTIASPGILEPDSGSVWVVVEIKLGAMKAPRSPAETKALGSAADFGQLNDYLLAVQCAQPGRRTCVGLLSDIDRTYVVTLGMGEAGAQVTQYAAESIWGVLSYLRDVALKDRSYMPPDLGFSPGIGQMRRRLGNPRHCIVGEFPAPPGAPGTVMAVKRITTKSRETYFLDLLAADTHRPACLPLIVHNLDDLEYGTVPVGTQLHATLLPNARQTRQVLADVISALQWLHARGIVHRDVRCENVVVVNHARAVLIDFDCAYDLRWSVPTVYRGGHICIPPAHLRTVMARGWEFPYVPALADDCYAVVLLAYTLLFPGRFADFRASRMAQTGAQEGPAMLTFWEELRGSRLWCAYMDAAAEGRVGDLKVGEVFY